MLTNALTAEPCAERRGLRADAGSGSTKAEEEVLLQWNPQRIVIVDDDRSVDCRHVQMVLRNLAPEVQDFSQSQSAQGRLGGSYADRVDWRHGVEDLHRWCGICNGQPSSRTRNRRGFLAV